MLRTAVIGKTYIYASKTSQYKFLQYTNLKVVFA